MHENKWYCEPMTPGEIENAYNDRLDDKIMATLYLQ